MTKFAPAGYSDFESDDDEFDFGHDVNLSVLSSLHDDIPEPTLPSVHINSQVNIKSNCLLDGDGSGNNIMLLSDLQNAVIKGNVEAVCVLLQSCHDLCNTILDSGWTALIYAANFGHLKIVNILLQEGADVSLSGRDGCTALIAACKCRNKHNAIEIVKVLLSKGANVSAVDQTQKTALTHAIKNGDCDLVKIVLSVSSDIINVKDNKGWTALDWAISKASQDNVKFLVEHGATMYDFQSDLSTTSLEIKSCLKSISTESSTNNVDDCETIENDNNNTTEQGSGSKEGDANNSKQNDLFSNMFSMDNQDDSDVVTIKTGEIDEGFQRYGQLELLLCGLELSHLIPKFHEHDVRFEQLLCASSDDLIAIGIIQVGARNRILSAIKDWHSVEWKESSLPNFSSTALNFGNLQALLRTSSEHLLYIGSSLRYAKAQLQTYPQVMIPPASIQMDDNPDSHIISQVENLLSSTHVLCQSLRSLHLQAVAIKNEKSKQYQQVDYIDAKNLGKSSRKKRNLIFISLPLITCLAFYIARHRCID